MNDFVLDASVALAWFLDDEQAPQADNVRARLARDRALVPQLWHLEVRNGLIIAERRGRLSATRMDECLDALKWLPIQTDSEAVLEMVVSLARWHKLSVYDAVYLELAKRRDAALASLDGALLRAAAKESVELLGQ
ncbi:MAG: type II toxin-antitoxin system VapC family toxin [Gammaproteobacteria bacterium]|nr:type II toxin-antitoxin system VapC family toxin [Gammaproteobacteria bacterium]